MAVVINMIYKASWTADDLVRDIQMAGVSTREPMLLHSSLKSLGNVEGGAAAVVAVCRMMFDTVLFPAFCGKPEDGPLYPPVCDLLNTPTWAGIIPETARMSAAARRSIHPTHSLTAFGTRATELLSGHENTHSPCDENSPFFRLAEANGTIVLLGCSQNSNTMVHCCEEVARVPYHLQPQFTAGRVIADNREVIVNNRLHDWSKPPTDFNKIEPLLLDCGAMRSVTIGQATAHVISAAKMLNSVVAALKQLPEFLLKHVGHV